MLKTLGNMPRHNLNTSDKGAWLDRAQLLIEAMPYLRCYSGAWVVIKLGGQALDDQEQTESFAATVGLLKLCGTHVVIVHGGAPQINRLLGRMGIDSVFADGLRVTSKEAVEIARMALCGQVNPLLVTMLNRHDCKALGLAGFDADLIQARRRPPQIDRMGREIDLGFVGDPVRINTNALKILSEAGYIPVVAPIAVSTEENGTLLNVNADIAAGAIAAALRATRFLLLTDVGGIKNAQGDVIEHLTISEADALLSEGSVIQGGMVPKVRTCLESIRAGVNAAVVLDGRQPVNIMLELFTHNGAGTLIEPDPTHPSEAPRASPTTR